MLAVSAAEMSLISCLVQLAEGEYHVPGESVQMPKQTSDEFSHGEWQLSGRHDVDQQAGQSSSVKKGSQQRPMIGRVTSTLDSPARLRLPQSSPTGYLL